MMITLKGLIAKGRMRAHIVLSIPRDFTSMYRGRTPPEKYIVTTTRVMKTPRPLSSGRERG